MERSLKVGQPVGVSVAGDDEVAYSFNWTVMGVAPDGSCTVGKVEDTILGQLSMEADFDANGAGVERNTHKPYPAQRLVTHVESARLHEEMQAMYACARHVGTHYTPTIQALLENWPANVLREAPARLGDTLALAALRVAHDRLMELAQALDTFEREMRRASQAVAKYTQLAQIRPPEAGTGEPR